MRYMHLPGGTPALEVGDQGDPLIILNGGQAFMRHPTARGFRREARRIVRLLPKGQGFLLLGYPGRAPENLDRVADDVFTAIAGKRHPLRLVGISYGGIVACRMAALRPGAVASLILIASADRFSREGADRVRRQVHLAERSEYDALVREFIGSFRRRAYNWLVHARLALRHHKVGRSMAEPAVIAAYLRAGLSAGDAEPRLASVSRTLILAGADDEFFGARPGEMEARIPRARAVIFGQERHTAPIECPEMFRCEIASFLSAGQKEKQRWIQVV